MRSQFITYSKRMWEKNIRSKKHNKSGEQTLGARKKSEVHWGKRKGEERVA